MAAAKTAERKSTCNIDTRARRDPTRATITRFCFRFRFCAHIRSEVTYFAALRRKDLFFDPREACLAEAFVLSPWSA